MANNELSGPTVVSFLADWIRQAPRKYTYRFIFIPETIGSITYISWHLDTLKRNVMAGFNIICVGDDRAYTLIHSRYGATFAAKVMECVLTARHPKFNNCSYFQRGSDERQYCGPKVDLPLVGFSRSLYTTYPKYHTSLDNLDMVSATGLLGSLNVLRDCVELIERNERNQVQCQGEPQLGERGL